MAAALVADAEAGLAEAGVEVAWLACAIGNDRAARFYEKCGWQRAGVEVYHPDGANEAMTLEVLRYEKRLSPTWVAMPRALLAVALSALSTTVPSTHGSQAPEGPRAVVRSAGAAVRGDSAARLRARWQTRLARDSSDRAAALGLATLARLTYDYPLAERLYNRLITGAGRADPYAVYARLGVAQGYDEYGSMTDIKRLLADALGEARALRDRAAEAEALLWVGYVGSRSTGLETALAYYDTALRVMPRGAIDLEAATRCRQAHALIVLGRAKSVARLTSATAFARQVDDPRARAPCVRAPAIALGHGGHADSAAAVYGEFADVLQRAHDRSGRALTLIWQAVSLREDLADYGDAREVLAEAQVDAVLSHNQYAAGGGPAVPRPALPRAQRLSRRGRIPRQGGGRVRRGGRHRRRSW